MGPIIWAHFEQPINCKRLIITLCLHFRDALKLKFVFTAVCLARLSACALDACSACIGLVGRAIGAKVNLFGVEMFRRALFFSFYYFSSKANFKSSASDCFQIDSTCFCASYCY